jgi:hypothetical protein
VGRRAPRTCWGSSPRTSRRPCTSSTPCGRRAPRRRARRAGARPVRRARPRARTPFWTCHRTGLPVARSAASAGQADPHRERPLDRDVVAAAPPRGRRRPRARAR